MDKTIAAIRRACEVCGSATTLAGLLGKSPQFISQMVRGERPVPAELCPAIERATQGAVMCEHLRPDVPWGVLRLQAAPADPKPKRRRQAAEQGV